MRIIQVTVRSAATVPHPRVPYANVRPEVMLTAELVTPAEQEYPSLCIKELQLKCDEYLADHVAALTVQLEAMR